MLLVQSLVVVCFFLALAIYSRTLIQSGLQSPGTNPVSIIEAYDSALTVIFLGLLAALALSSIFVARKLVFPIGRMIVKTRSVLESGPEAQIAEKFERLDEESYGEWSDLESAIEEIRRDLETKIESLKEEREEQAILMSSISDAILAVDVEEAPLFYNSRFALLFGNQSLGKNSRLWEIFRSPQILSAFHAGLAGIKGDTPDTDLQPTSLKAVPLELAGGGKRYFSLSVSPLRRSVAPSDGGPLQSQIYGAVGIFHDVTDLKRAEQIRIDFVANVSHELRTPLTSIKGYTDTLKLDLEAGRPVSPEFLDVILRNTTRLMNLMNDLLDLSSLESSHPDLSPAVEKSGVIEPSSEMLLSTQESTQRILAQMQSAFQSKNQAIKTTFSQTQVLADPRRLEQVLVNLLDNAHKYTPEGGTLSVHWASETIGPKSYVVLQVSDTGPGIPSEHLPRLFERFYRVDKARSREKGGTGLGLAIVKHIMQAHGGSVSVESTLGVGSVFTCRFSQTKSGV